MGNKRKIKWAYAWGEGKKETKSVRALSRGKAGEQVMAQAGLSGRPLVHCWSLLRAGLHANQARGKVTGKMSGEHAGAFV